MKKLLFASLLLVVAGCSTTASQTYIPPVGAGGEEAWKVEGQQSTLGEITVTVNGELAMKGSVSVMTGEGEFKGAYRGQELLAKCARASGRVRTRCVITKGDERIAVLNFQSL